MTGIGIIVCGYIVQHCIWGGACFSFSDVITSQNIFKFVYISNAKSFKQTASSFCGAS